MIQTLTIQIARPDFANIPREHRKTVMEMLAKEIVEQIVRQEDLRQRDETVRYWQNKLIEWQIETQMIEAMYYGNDNR